MSAYTRACLLTACERQKPNRTCESTQVAVADVTRTSAPRHAAGVRMWLKETTEWVGGWGVGSVHEQHVGGRWCYAYGVI